ncbi:MFS transporter [Liquorilactobacillus satsumensis]|uniref:MFS transporter n=1 Tax=Liquorilactobacillus satsumensis TaxID=259059 RepID=UPI001E61E804|nr:MFS transporter [Liquorilactobacillus satsumensis]MCC7667778.1 MFS transporter [Liquorilactobacillus satsumensis]MCP9328578.1 MFS transporter [Liquorilactobacillus satsumensis]MCP9356885.1 MFS transporter [Liquorilactobacillus satsumensis]MCP9370832.1 MFS transporter [Liquorilactobacillus satsumensis]
MQKQNDTRSWLALAALCIGVFMSLLDVTIVNVALPTIQKDLHDSFSDAQWIISGYTLAYASILLFASKIGDLFGRKKIFMLELLIFTLGSLGSALSQTAWQLNFFRVIQGIGGAGVMSLSMTIIATLFPPQKRGIAFGIWSSVVGFATAIGPLVGGFLVQQISWRAIFMINLPIGVLALIISAVTVGESQVEQAGKIDWAGMVISIAMVFCLIFGLVQKENHLEWTWSNPHVLGYLLSSLILLVAFIVLESRLEFPMLELAIFKSSAFVGTAVAGFCLGASLYGFFVYLTVWMQDYLGYTAIQTGIRQLAISLFSLFLGPLIGIFSNRVPKKWLISAGLLLIALGMGVILNVVSIHVVFGDFVIGFMLLGIGNAVINPPLSTAAMESVKPQYIGMASGTVNVFRQLGISFGVVILGLGLNEGYKYQLTRSISSLNLPTQIKTKLSTGFSEAGPLAGNSVLKGVKSYFEKYQVDPHVFQQLTKGIFAAYNHGYRNVLLLCISMAVIGAAGSLILTKRKK